MNRSRIILVTLAFLTLAAVFVLPASRALETKRATAKNTAGKITGTWKLVSFEARAANGEIRYPSGRDATGYIMYDTTGRMAVQFMRAARPAFTSRPATPEEKRQAFDSYTAYFANYEINEPEGIVIHHMEGNLNPNLTGTDYIRYYEFEGDKLILTPTEKVEGKFKPKSSATLRLVWQRVK